MTQDEDTHHSVGALSDYRDVIVPGISRRFARNRVQRLLALNAIIWFNWLIGAPVKRSLTAYDHV